jgi:serine/threonine protein phosphatase PrpC
MNHRPNAAEKLPQPIELTDEDIIVPDIEKREVQNIDEGDFVESTEDADGHEGSGVREIPKGVLVGVAPGRRLFKPPRPDAVMEADLLATAEELQNLEQTKVEIETAEVEGFASSRVIVGMKVGQKNVEQNRPCEDYVIAVPDQELVGVADGISSSSGGQDGEGLNAAARASRVLSATMADRFGDIAKEMTTPRAELALKGAKILDLDPEISTVVDLPTSMDAASATRMIEALIEEHPEVAKKAGALIEAISEANAAVLKTKGQTTACLAVREGEYLIIANVGDSRGFIERDGKFIPVTREDTLLNHLLEVGALSKDQVRKMRENPNQPESVDFSSLGLKGAPRKIAYTQLSAMPMGGLGDPAQPKLAIPTITILKIKPGMIFAAMTDGVSDKIQNPDGSIDLQTLQKHLGRQTKGSDADRMTRLIEESAKRETATKASDDDKTITRMEIK